MESSSSASNSTSGTGSVPSASTQSTDKGPLWEYVTKVSKSAESGGTWKFKCNFCHEIKTGSYSRVKAHLLQLSGKGVSTCKKVSHANLLEMRTKDIDYERIKINAAPRDVPLPGGGLEFQNTTKKRKSNLSPLAKAFDVDARTQLDEEIARMFYTGGLSFNLARNPYYMRAFMFAANQNLGGYVPPSYNKLRTSLVQQEKANVERLLQPIKDTWKEMGVSFVTDGWSDPQRRPLINFMATSSKGPMFIKAVNCMGEVKTKEYIANLMQEVINEIGHQNVVQIITDNAANCKGAGELIEGLYPHIYWTPCVVHTLNLALKNICAARNTETNSEVYTCCSWITEIHGQVVQIKFFIMNHTMRLSMYNKFTPLKLFSVAETRFASIIVMLKRFKLVKRALESLVMSEEWASYREDDQDKARFVREKVLNEDWWGKVDYILNFTAPIYDMIRACDTDRPCLHLVYEMWDSMIEKVKVAIYNHEQIPLDRNDSFSLFYNVVYEILIARWTKSSTPLHCLAHSLNPRYYSDAWLSENQARVAPHRDGEISQERRKCFERLYSNVDDYDKVLNEFASFSLKTGPFSDIGSLSRMGTMEAKTWWANFGAETPLLQALAFRVLDQPTSSSCSERNWSTYSFVNSLKRNKLTPKRAEDLVFVHNNLRDTPMDMHSL
ncbi:putative hAT dimerization domain, ribonuclease H-like domain protein [Tanacetum coccineum]|uniref:HAT dimerization domain, ribonuclease H-like domain protein n=1 Tax=Tanacetum coccineum TaxID=301880 RepID=A0ABQ5CCR9_9ASTR